MKRIVILFITFIIFNKLQADEGMWLPQLIKSLNITDMKKNGFMLTPEQLYDINKPSLKDAIVLFGGGCTAEIISDKGLILTNHHCGFSAIAYHSTVTNDFLTTGFWAMNASEEKYTPNLTATIIKKIEDVTDALLNTLPKNISEQTVDSLIQIEIKKLETKAAANSHYKCFIKPFFYGNKYYLFTTEVFKDVRLVGAPPSAIGKFGGEADNWMWPRHNGDFSVFRIYANDDNKPADYNINNKPYKPDYVIPISLKGYQENDFTMVYGFPGRTQEYLTSYAVDLIQNTSDPIKTSLREKRLRILEEAMKTNDTIRLAYANKYQGLANYYKKWTGEMIGLKQYEAIAKKEAAEKEFETQFEKNSDIKRKYINTLSNLKKHYADIKAPAIALDYFNECLLTIDLFTHAANIYSLCTEYDKLIKKEPNSFKANFEELKKLKHYKSYFKSIDIKLCQAMIQAYITEYKNNIQPKFLDSICKKFQYNVQSITNYFYANTNLADKLNEEYVLSKFPSMIETIKQDPAVQIAIAISYHYTKHILPNYTKKDKQIIALQKQYVKAQIELTPNKNRYPDANGTLRIAYGQVKGYKPKDAVEYHYQTTLDGIMEKENIKDEDFIVPEKLKLLYTSKNYHIYADKNGKLPVAFIASNHTTGGNSGSPVFNKNGELIGTNFDRNWEGTMSDIAYNPKTCRNIIVDIRYTLFIIDKFAGASYLVKEMKIIK